MKRSHIYLIVALLSVFLAACATPKIDTTDLKAEISNARAGHYGQAMLHEEMSQKELDVANAILGHIEKDHYWNINQKQKALDAAKASREHRVEAEKEMCKWLTEAHSQNHHKVEASHHTIAYFNTGSATPSKIVHDSIMRVGQWLQDHPDATAVVAASTDTVGQPGYNQALSEARADAVVQRLIKAGARTNQLSVKATGEAAGPDNTPNQENRVATITTSHPSYLDCPQFK